jgi:DNA uptake protein ComE-like DNA-binding protein
MEFTTIALLTLSGAAIVGGLSLSRRLLQAPTSLTILWQDPRYRFRSLLELNQAVRLGFRLDVSTATIDDWLRLPLFSIHQARLLVQLQRGGVAFHCPEDIAAALGWTPAQIAPLSEALRFTYYEADSPLNCPRLNPNRTEGSKLLTLPGMNPALVQQLINDREQRGPFRDLADFQARLNLPGEQISDLMHYLIFQE